MTQSRMEVSAQASGMLSPNIGLADLQVEPSRAARSWDGHHCQHLRRGAGQKQRGQGESLQQRHSVLHFRSLKRERGAALDSPWGISD